MTKEEKMELTRKVGLFGLSDLRKISPIGDLGYMNGWYPPFWGNTDMWLDVELPKAIMKAFDEQYKKFGFKEEVLTDFGQVDILINNAGITADPFPIWNQSG